MDNKHWQEAQEAARKEGGSNFVVTPDGKAFIAGYPEYGWIIVSSTQNLKLEARTAQGVELALEELGLPSLGWT